MPTIPLAVASAERYPTAESFGGDLRAYLEGRPVSVYRYGTWAQTRRLVRRHPGPFAALVATFLVSIAGVFALFEPEQTIIMAKAPDDVRVFVTIDIMNQCRNTAMPQIELAVPLPVAVFFGGLFDPAARRDNIASAVAIDVTRSISVACGFFG